MDNITLEKMILSRVGNWTFDKHVSKIFDDHVRKSIPCYDDVQRLIALISRQILPDHAFVYDLGTATGEVIFNIEAINHSKELSFVGIDQSDHMLNMAKKKCQVINNVTFRNEKIETFDYLPSNLIVSAFTLQFVEIPKRRDVLNKIKDSIMPNGYFILCEKMSFPNDESNSFFRQVHENWKLRHFSPDEINSKKNSLKNVMQLLSMSEYSDMLREVGFRQIDVFFQWCNFVCILAQ
ncbi:MULTISPECIES: methyltransferase domain-containing protein [unclassified Saccharicrinis]|uniref:methyltransferase domain-containing protein n=1 Tax=unclassified Saccharicrinis TaxID=2646859 RepID=UPI003D33DCB5